MACGWMGFEKSINGQRRFQGIAWFCHTPYTIRSQRTVLYVIDSKYKNTVLRVHHMQHIQQVTVHKLQTHKNETGKFNYNLHNQTNKTTAIMDYEGQKLCENLFYWIIIIFGSIGWVYGYMEQDFSYVFYAWVVGMVISLILCVPDWPWFNKHPIKWLEAVPDRRIKQ
jgi:Microsomal signal peptidase 12 kDa subunit (SPC12).